MPSWSDYGVMFQRYVISPTTSALLVGGFLSAMAWPIRFLSPMASLNGCYPQWLLLMRLLSPMAPLTGCYPRWLLSPIRFLWVSLSIYPRWHVSPYGVWGFPSHFDRDGVYRPYDSCLCRMSALWPFSPTIAFAFRRVMWILRFAHSWGREFLLRLGTGGS